MQEITEKLQKLLEVTVQLTTNTEMEKMFQEILSAAVSFCGAEGGSIYFYDHLRRVLTFEYVISPVPEVAKTLKRFELQLGEGIAGTCALEQKPILLTDVQKDKRFASTMDLFTGYITKNLLTVPMKYCHPDTREDVLVGVLQLVNKKAGNFTGEDVWLLEILSSQGAILIERNRLYKSLREQFLGTIAALAAAVDARDPYTHGHSLRVAKYAVALGRALGKNEQELFDLRLSCLLHDIGKIGIPDDILKKQSRLSDTEFALMKTHPEEGYRILRPVKLSPQILGGVLHHHERWDGTGYPLGLKGKEIPEFGRIIAFADALDAITTNRPYRPAKSFPEALDEILANAGKQFDPEISEVFQKEFPSLIQ